MSSRLFQTVIYQMKDVIPRKIGVVDDTNTIVACTDVTEVGLEKPGVYDKITDNVSRFVIDGITYKRGSGRARIDYVVFCEGEDETADEFCGLLCIAFANLKQMYDEKYDKTNFIKGILTDNILVGDMYFKAKELKLQSDVSRVAFLAHMDVGDYTAQDIVKGLFPDKSRDFVVGINENDVVLIKEVRHDISRSELYKIATTIYDTISGELMVDLKIGIGSVVNTVQDIARSYKDAQVALEVGRVFESENAIVSYDNLGIGRIIYQLPTKLCQLFLSEVFKRGDINDMDEEMITTIQKFFENNLNVSEASRQLYVHRNTLVYRLDKILKQTGLDIRNFDDAIIFKVAMMVNKYLNSSTINI